MQRSKVLDAIREFNEFRSPEATAELISINENVVIVRMSGTYCVTCGLFDYFEDLVWTLKDHLGSKVKIISTKQLDPFSYEIAYEIEEK